MNFNNVNNVHRLLLAVSKYRPCFQVSTVIPIQGSRATLEQISLIGSRCLHSITASSSLLSANSCNFVSPSRQKYYGKKTPKKSSEYESDDDSEDEEEEAELLKKENVAGSKVVQIQIDSLRCDLILKNGLGISRNKLEMFFYESRFRVNGKKITKKSYNIHIGDACDVVKDFYEENPNFINVSRVEVLKARPTGDFIMLTVRKYKNLLVENYEQDPWEGIQKSTDEETDLDKKLS